MPSTVHNNFTPVIKRRIQITFGMLFFVAFGLNAFAQVPLRYVPHVVPHTTVVRQNPGRRMELVKENYISIRLKLTLPEARAFWPLYRQYVQDQTAIRILKRQNNSNSSADGTAQIDKELAYEQQLVEIRKHYRDEFLKILSPEKVSELYKAERAFADEAVRILSERSVRAGN